MPGRKAPEDERRAAILDAAFAVAVRERLAGLSARQVAEEAGVSKGLIFFHFKSRDGLLLALLDHLLASMAVEPPVASDAPPERLRGALDHALARLPEHRRRIELFIDYWVMGADHLEIRRRIRAALDRFQATLRPLAAVAAAADPQRWRDEGPAGLAAPATSFIAGCALELVMEPDRVDFGAWLQALAAIVADPATLKNSRDAPSRGMRSLGAAT